MSGACDKLNFKDSGAVVLGCAFCGQPVKPDTLHRCWRKTWVELKQKLSAVVARKRMP